MHGDNYGSLLCGETVRGKWKLYPKVFDQQFLIVFVVGIQLSISVQNFKG